MSGLVQSIGAGDVQAYHIYLEEPAVTWIRGQVAAWMSTWLNESYPLPERCWHVLKVRPMGDLDTYHRLFGSVFPQPNEIRMVVFSNCGRERYRLDAVSFDADRLGAQIEVVPVVAYVGCEMPV